MPWHGWPPAPARPSTGDGSPTNSRTISVIVPLRSVFCLGVRVSLSLDSALEPAPDTGGRHGVAERGIRSRRREPPGARLLGYAAHGRVLHPRTRHAPNQNDRPPGRVRPALLLRHWRG